jgi:hypothetical protein
VFSHRGTLVAHGFWFSRRSLARATCERRALAVWRPGAEIRALADDLIVVLPAPRRVAAEGSPGAPLIDSEGVLTSAPLAARERHDLESSVDLVIVDGGQSFGYARAALREVDAAAWLDVTKFELGAATPLGELAAPAAKIAPASDSGALYDAHAGRTKADHTRITQLVRAVAGADDSELIRHGSGLLEHTARGLRSLWRWLRRPASANARTTALSRGAPASSLWQRWRAALARFIGRTRLMSLLNRKQAEYLSALLDALDRHDDLDVLRRAIPLGHDSQEMAAPALVPPSLRSKFEISLTRRAPGPTLTLVQGLYADLRRAYEAVFERLNAAGKHEQAAFFLAEILNDPARAVAYLERHENPRLAAELAEARKLAPGLVVRLWFLAGERARAVAIAVREAAFDDAIARLERSGRKAEAAALRLLQAERLASAGRLVAAARSIRELEPGRALALEWLRRARETGQASGIALELSLAGDRFQVVSDALDALLARDGSDARRERVALARDFTQLAPPQGHAIAQKLARELLADATTLGDSTQARTAQTLARYVSGAFQADFPAVTRIERRTPRSCEHHRYARTDTGTRALHDAVALGSRFVVALGEAGVALVDARGRVVAHFDQPAETLVIAQDSVRVLTLARRGEALRIGRIDLASRRSDHWGEVRATAYARRFDGQVWAVASAHRSGDGAELLLLDACDERPAILRQLPLPLLPHGDIAFDDRHCYIVGAPRGGLPEQLRYELPSFTLRSRSPVHLARPFAPAVFAGICTAGEVPVVWERWLDPETGHSSVPRFRRGARELVLDASAPDVLPGGMDALGDFAAASGRTAEGVKVLIGNVARQRLAFELELEGASRAVCRLDLEHAVVVDDTGRLLSLDLAHSRCSHDLRF